MPNFIPEVKKVYFCFFAAHTACELEVLTADKPSSSWSGQLVELSMKGTQT